MIYTIDHFQQITKGCLLIEQPGHTAFKWLSTDTRQIINGPVSLFIALKGPFHNAHDHLADALDKGVVNFIVSEKPPEELIEKANWLIVNDTLQALQEIARFHRLQYDIPIIGITGSNGKTWVKEWMHQLLRERFNIAKSHKSYNSQIGVPLSV
jgi:alanine racemase